MLSMTHKNKMATSILFDGDLTSTRWLRVWALVIHGPLPPKKGKKYMYRKAWVQHKCHLFFAIQFMFFFLLSKPLKNLSAFSVFLAYRLLLSDACQDKELPQKGPPTFQCYPRCWSSDFWGPFFESLEELWDNKESSWNLRWRRFGAILDFDFLFAIPSTMSNDYIFFVHWRNELICL